MLHDCHAKYTQPTYQPCRLTLHILLEQFLAYINKVLFYYYYFI